MKRLFLLVFCLFFVFNLSSQKWFANNPEWCSGTTSSFGGDQKLYSYKTIIEGDSLIDNQNYKILKTIRQTRDGFVDDTSYYEYIAGLFYEEDEKVYARRNEGIDQVIYDFSLVVGDTMFLPNTSCEDVKMILETTGIEVIDGEDVRYQDFSLDYDYTNDILEPSYDTLRVYEGVGLIFGPYYYASGYLGFNPQSNIFCGWVDPPTWFYNYSNDLFEYKERDFGCNFFDEEPTSIDQLYNVNSIEIYPNPCVNEFRLELTGEVDNISGRISDINGKVVLGLNLIDNQIVDVIDLSPGMYFLDLFSKGNFLVRKKLIKSAP
jgi:hypothetical protein